MISLIKRKCPQCQTDNSQNGANRFSHENWQVKTCSTCGFVYLENTPNYKDLENLFPWEETKRTENNRRIKNRGRWIFAYHAVDGVRSFINGLTKRNKLHAMCTRYFAKGDVVDLGCDTGNDVGSVPTYCRPIGIEISKPTVLKAQPKFEARGGYVIHADVLNGLKQLPDASVTGAILKSYLEHEINPIAVLQEIKRVLKPDGVIIIKVPNFNSLNRIVKGKKWCGFRYPDHVNYFTPATMAKMIQTVGLSKKRCHWLDRLPTSDNLWFIAQK
jgi:SAM-dependent methyltransferase